MKKVLLIGSTGLVGSRVKELLKNKYQLITPEEQESNLLNKDSLGSFFNQHKPEAIINFAAYTNVNQAENQTGDKTALCWQVNVEGVNNILKTINKNTQFIHISTDMVFSGGQEDPGPYKESHFLPSSPGKLTWYGWTKNRAEKLVKDSGYTIVRIIYPVRSKFERPDYLRFPLRKYREDSLYPIFSDQQVSITFIDELAKALKEIIDQKHQGIFHVSSSNVATPIEIISYLFKRLNLDTKKIKSSSIVEYLSSQKNLYRYLAKGGLSVQSTEKKLGLKFSTHQEIIDTLIEQGLTLKNA